MNLHGVEFPYPGRCFGSKSGYFNRHPGCNAVFNANLVTRSKGKVWYGDLDLAVEADRDLIQRLADAIGEDVHVLREMDCRFDTEDAPAFEKAVMVFSPAAG